MRDRKTLGPKEDRMQRKVRSGIARGVVLILIGALLLVWQLVPEIRVWIDAESSWPLFVVVAGVLLLLIGLLTGASGMAVPACVVGGIGGILWYQNSTGDWESWAYAWALIPGFVGVGIIISGLLDANIRTSLREGIWPIVISAILFAVFGAAFGGLGVLGDYWPVLLIVLGVLLLARLWFGSRRGSIRQ